MKTTVHLVLLLAIAASTGDLRLRQLPEKILGDFNQTVTQAVPAPAFALAG